MHYVTNRTVVGCILVQVIAYSLNLAYSAPEQGGRILGRLFSYRIFFSVNRNSVVFCIKKGLNFISEIKKQSIGKGLKGPMGNRQHSQQSGQKDIDFPGRRGVCYEMQLSTL